MTELTIQIKLPGRNDNVPVVINQSDNILQVKEKVAQHCPTPADRQRLIFAGRVLKDQQTVTECKIVNGVTVHMVPIPEATRTSTPAQSSTSQPTTGGSPSPFSNTPPPAGSSSSTQPNQPNPFGGGLGGMGGLFNMFGGGDPTQGGGFPSMAQMQQQMMQNPQLMQQVMQSPLMQQMHQRIMNDPEILRNIIMSNPQMQSIIDRNPEIGHILQDPALLRQTMQAAQNPEIMREMMRSTDRTLSHIENMPGGFNLLRQQYENIVEPFQQAAQMPVPQYDQNPSQTTTPPSPNPNADPLPNPWASNNPSGGAPAGDFAFPGLFGNLGGNAAAGNPAGGNAAGGNAAGGNAGGLFGMDSNQMNQMLQMASQIFGSPQTAQGGETGDQQQQQQQQQQQGQVPNYGNMFSMMSNLFGQQNPSASPFGAPTTPPQPQQYQSPEARFAVQLQQLNDMGFNDQAANIRCLTATGGNVNLAIERLLSGL